MSARLIAWFVWSVFFSGVARSAWRDWHDPKQDRHIIKTAALIAALIAAITAETIFIVFS